MKKKKRADMQYVFCYVGMTFKNDPQDITHDPYTFKSLMSSDKNKTSNFKQRTTQLRIYTVLKL